MSYDIKVNDRLMWSMGLYFDAPDDNTPDVDHKIIRTWRKPGEMIHIDQVRGHFSGHGPNVIAGSGAFSISYRRRLKSGALGQPQRESIWSTDRREPGYDLPEWLADAMRAMRDTAQKYVREWLA